jgi:hypothetical protein
VSFTTILAIVVAVLTAGVGVVSVVFNLGADFRAEHKLVQLMARSEHADSLERLTGLRRALLTPSPDRETLDGATEVVRTLASELSRPQKRAVLATLTAGSDISAAVYIVRLVDEATRLSRDTGAGAGP